MLLWLANSVVDGRSDEGVFQITIQGVANMLEFASRHEARGGGCAISGYVIAGVGGYKQPR